MNIKQENQIMAILKTKEIIIPLVRTPIGELTAKRHKDELTYTFMLDSVILPKEDQKELSKVWETN